MTSEAVLCVRDLRFRYGTREVLCGVSFAVRRGELFGVLGPNGSGKSTLFRILSTSVAPSAGRAEILGRDVVREAPRVRWDLGVVFQRPSVDGKLTVLENVLYHGRLYGLGGASLRERAGVVLGRLGLDGRMGDRVETLSGGLQRRVELAKALLHRPRILILDEPSTGLDPSARRDFGRSLERLRTEGVTALLTTHDLDEAERCDRIAILDRGRVVAVDAPGRLKAAVGGDVVVVRAAEPEKLGDAIAARFGYRPKAVDGTLRIEHPRGHEFVRDLVEAFREEVASVSFGKPTLEDVFVHLTGHRFDPEGGSLG